MTTLPSRNPGGADPTSRQILLVEDDPRLSDLISDMLREAGHAVTVCRSGREGERRALQESYDLVILDRILPDHEGVALCRALRHGGFKDGILMLTALDQTDQRILGLDAGADDYLGKPFEPSELLARINAITRRSAASEPGPLVVADLEIDVLRREARRAGQPIRLTAKEFKLLEFLARNAGKVVSRLKIAEAVWDEWSVADKNVIEVYVSRLRGKIDRDFDAPLLHTIIGHGYTLSSTPPELPGRSREFE